MARSPFPGMGPYLEAPAIWLDVHTSLMSIFREQLTPLLASKYLAELETQVVILMSGFSKVTAASMLIHYPIVRNHALLMPIDPAGDHGDQHLAYHGDSSGWRRQ